MIPIFIGVAWLNLVTMVIAACRVAAHADAIELEIIVQGDRATGRSEAIGRSEDTARRVAVRA
jgi:hypothetical protein